MSDDMPRGLTDPEARHEIMRHFAWRIQASAVDKMIVLFVLHLSDPALSGDDACVTVTVTELAEKTGGTRSAVRVALQRLIARDILRESSGRSENLRLSVDFDGLRRAFLERGDAS